MAYGQTGSLGGIDFVCQLVSLQTKKRQHIPEHGRREDERQAGRQGAPFVPSTLGTCLWHLDCRWHAFGLGAHGTIYHHCGFDQPLSSNSRFQNRVAGPRVRASPRVMQRAGNCRSDPIPLPRGRQFVTLKDAAAEASRPKRRRRKPRRRRSRSSIR